MLNIGKKPSEKLQLIDHATYESMQTAKGVGGHAVRVHPIRNAKFKNTRGEFNLLSYVKPKKKTERRKIRRRLTASLAHRTMKKRTKKREAVCKRSRTRLKKSIMRYRQLKRTAEVQKLADQVEMMTIEEPGQLSTGSLKKIPGLHSRRFRAYCDNCTTDRLNALTDKLLRELDRFQKRAFATNEYKARAHRRFVVGFREAQSFVCISKAKLVIIAPDCEECSGEDGLDETVLSLKSLCQEKQVPVCYSLRRRQLAYALFKRVPVSCIAILDYDGARDIFAELIEALKEARDQYVFELSKKITSDEVG